MRDNDLSKEELEFLDVGSRVFKKVQSLEEYKSDIKYGWCYVLGNILQSLLMTLLNSIVLIFP